MAAVAPAGERSRRAQIIVVTGLLLATLLVGLALVLNAAVFTENIATGGDSAGSSDALSHQYQLRVDAATALERVNRDVEGKDYDRLETELRWHLENRSREAGPHFLVNSDFANGTGLDPRRGTRVNHSSGEFTPNSEAILKALRPISLNDPAGLNSREDWLVAPDVRVREFRMTVQRDALATGSALGQLFGNEVFAVEFANGSATYQIRIPRDDVDGDGTDEIVVEAYRITDSEGLIDDSDATQIGQGCTAEGPSATVDITDERVAGEPCPALGFVRELGGNYDIRYINGENAEGSYELTVEKPESQFRAELETSYGPVITAVNSLLFDNLPSGVSQLLDGVLGVTGVLSDLVGDIPGLNSIADLEAALNGLDQLGDGVDSTDIYSGDCDDSPCLEKQLYAARLDTTYASAGLVYEGRLRVAPGEPDYTGAAGPSVPPNIEIDGFVDASQDDGFLGISGDTVRYEYEFTVTASDADVEAVYVTLSDATNQTVGSADYSPSPPTGAVTVDDALEISTGPVFGDEIYGEKHTVRIIAVDADGDVTQRVLCGTANGDGSSGDETSPGCST